MKVCPRCGSHLKTTKSLSGGASLFWKECSNVFCGSMVDTWKPLAMQHNFCKDPHTYKGTFGGFGSGKSLAVIKNIEKHIMITPNAYVAVIGYTFRQIKRNFVKDFDEDMPAKFMVVKPNQKTPGFNSGDNLYTLKNGAKIELITADEEGKIRGLNASLVVLLEASNVPYIIFDRVKSRLRNVNAMVIEKDENGEDIYILDEETGEMKPKYKYKWFHILLESNPDAGWINKNFLLEGEWIQFYGSSYNKYPYKLNKINDEYSLHITATDSNPYLPDNYLEINTANKPEWEVKRFYYGSFFFSENMVYPNISKCIVDPYPIDFNSRDIFFIIGYDYGLADQSAFVFLVVNMKKNLLIQYDELGVDNMSVKEIATEYRKKLSIIPDGKLLFLPKMDAKSYNKRQADKETIGKMFEDVGLYFDPIQEAPESRMFKLNSLINNGQLQIFRNNVQTIEQMTDYKKATNSKGEVLDKRVDRRNHFPDALEFATIKLPVNLEKMKIEDYIVPGYRVVPDRWKAKEESNLTPKQQLIKSLNPMNFSNQQTYVEEEVDERDFDEIIKKLSGI